jgi:hypothetical protein
VLDSYDHPLAVRLGGSGVESGKEQDCYFLVRGQETQLAMLGT